MFDTVILSKGPVLTEKLVPAEKYWNLVGYFKNGHRLNHSKYDKFALKPYMEEVIWLV